MVFVNQVLAFLYDFVNLCGFFVKIVLVSDIMHNIRAEYTESDTISAVT